MAFSTSTIAQGCFGKVYKQRYNGTWAAVKKIPKELIEKKALERECDVYNLCEHPNIVKLLGDITVADGKWIIPLEFIFGEDLETTIFNSAKSKIELTPAAKSTIITGMCEGLHHLHSKDVVHQDLKPENIMVEHRTNRAVIIDLGLAKFFKYGLNSAWDMGNEAYSAPEVLQRHTQRNQRSDVWAMGKIIGELCAQVRFHTPNVCPAQIRDNLKDHPYCQAVCRMVAPDPFRRATMSGIIADIRAAGEKDSVGSKRFVVLEGKDAAGPKDRLPPPKTDARNMSPSPTDRHETFFERLRNKRTPKPELERNLQAGPHPGLFPKRAQNDDKKQHLAPNPKRGSDPTEDFARMHLQEAAKKLPFNLPTTGRVMVTHLEQRNRAVERREQRRFITRQGQVIEMDEEYLNIMLRNGL